MTKQTSTKEENKEIKMVEVPVDIGEVSFDDLTNLTEETQKIEKESEKQFKGMPVAMPDGRMVVRFIPDRDAKGKLRFFKRVWFHTIPGYATGKSKTKDNEERFRVINSEVLDKELKNAESQGMKDTFKYRANEHVYLFVRVIECRKSDYLKPGQDVILVLTGPQGMELIKFYNELNNEQKMALLTPSKPHYGVEMVFEDKASKFKKLESVKFAGSTQHVIETVKYPEGFQVDKEKGGLLDQVYVNEFDNTMTDEQFTKIKNFLRYQVSFSSSMRDPVDQDEVEAPSRRVESSSQQSKPAPVDSGEKCYIKQNGLNTKENGYEGVEFANPPKDLSAECMICPAQSECEAAVANKR